MTGPYTAHQVEKDGVISYEIFDEPPDTYRLVCTVNDHGNRGVIGTKAEAEMIAHALNLLTAIGAVVKLEFHR